MVIGTFAYCGSGQDTLADSICKYYEYNKYSMGDLLRKFADINGLKKTRESLRTIRLEYDKKYGRFYFPKLMIKQIEESSSKNIIITGIRTIEEYIVFKKELNIKLIFVYADEHIRYQRMLNRCDEKDELSIELLIDQMYKESITFDYEQLEKLADLKYCFNMPIEEYLNTEEIVINKIIESIGE